MAFAKRSVAAMGMALLAFVSGCASRAEVPAAPVSMNAASCGMNFRWLNNAGFEIVLRSGAHLLVDPWLDSAKFYPVPLDSLERADYLVLSHIHFDHAQDVGVIQKKFPGVRIFTGMLSAEPLAREKKLDVSRLYKVTDGQEFKFEDVTIKAFAGRHTESIRGNYLKWESDGHISTESMGTLDLYQYLITDADGTKFMIWAGTPSIDNANRLAGVHADLAAVHVSPKQDIALLARVVNAIDAKVVMPHHYDIWPYILRTMPSEAQQFPSEVQPVTPDNVISKTMAYVSRRLAEGHVKAGWFIPEHHAWYHYDPASRKALPCACARGT
jgi:L-ascorbate metabolism protein UlaG (beta-lactamase superfamily)